jgi:hypothetical protein
VGGNREHRRTSEAKSLQLNSYLLRERVQCQIEQHFERMKLGPVHGIPELMKRPSLRVDF